MPPPPPTPLSPHLIPTLLSADASIYPSPLTLPQLTSWITATPSSSLQYLTPDNSLCGVVVTLPLSLHHWTRLINGEIKEWDITPDMFADDDDDGGVHVWHVERYPPWKREWGRFAEVVQRDLGLRSRRWSALCVTGEGVEMFRRLGGKEGEYRGQIVVGGRVLEREGWDGNGEVQAVGRMLVGGV
ncbi:hypothetical protein K440DRAFT_661070 [Wilcoxina mikolae CBS 423.85]|nr:hypothetical protein K440DRAFT_661070 [Wilcoxina mikolae CBS 423.85]